MLRSKICVVAKKKKEKAHGRRMNFACGGMRRKYSCALLRGEHVQYTRTRFLPYTTRKVNFYYNVGRTRGCIFPVRTPIIILKKIVLCVCVCGKRKKKRGFSHFFPGVFLYFLRPLCHDVSNSSTSRVLSYGNFSQ